MNNLVIAAIGTIAGLGLCLFFAGLLGRPILDGWPSERVRRFSARLGGTRLALAGLAALCVLALTGWLAGSLLTAGAILIAPRILGGGAARQLSVRRTEAIAAWTEMIRDSIAAASGLEEAITATGPIAPEAIRPEVTRLVRRLHHTSLIDALTAFGVEVAHPSADLVVAALTIAARVEASDLTGLLSRLADSIRGEARMRIRVDVGRTQVRAATKIIVGVVAATVALLMLLNRQYLSAYDTPGGQLVLVAVAGIFGLGGWLLVRMGDLDFPDRFTARPIPGAQR